jgi:hypothetical protein
MGDDGQMILLSALVACLCLMGVVACVTAVDDSAYRGNIPFSADMLANARWSQENALERTANYYSAYPWDDRVAAAYGFKSEANASVDSLGLALLKHGEAYQFLYNDSLAGEYAALHPGNGTENVGGVLVERSGNKAMLRGCAYDMAVGDGAITYRVSRVIIFD